MNTRSSLCSIPGIFLLCALFLALPFTDASAQKIPITTSSKEALNLFILGRENLANVQARKATQYFDQAIEKDPNFALAYLYRAQSGGTYQQAMENIEKAVSLSGNVSNGEKLLIMATEAGFESNRVKEKSYINQLDKSYPNDKWAQTQIGQYYFRNSDYKSALKHFDRVLKIDSKFAPPYNMIGYSESQLGNYSAAENAFKKYISLIPNDPNPYDSYAELLQKIGKYDESTTQYEKALSIDPEFISSLKGIGDNYLFKGDYTKAREYYDKEYQTASNINDRLAALFWKAVSCIHENKIPEAMEIIQRERAEAKSANLQARVFNIDNTSAFILCEEDKADEALKKIDQASAMIAGMSVPETIKDNFRTQAMLAKSYALTQGGKMSEAANEANQAEVLIKKHQNPNQMKMLNFVRGMQELKQGHNNKAISYLAKADNESPVTWYYTAEAYLNIGNKSKSVALYKKISHWNVNGLDLALVRNQAIQKLNADGVSASN